MAVRSNTFRMRIIQTADQSFRIHAISTRELMNPPRRVSAMKELEYAARRLHKEIAARDTEIERLRTENERLRAVVRSMGGDPR